MTKINAKIHVEFEVEIPDGWEFVRLAVPQDGEYYLSEDGRVLECESGWATPTVRPWMRYRAIVRKDDLLAKIESKAREYAKSGAYQFDRTRFLEIADLAKKLRNQN